MKNDRTNKNVQRKSDWQHHDPANASVATPALRIQQLHGVGRPRFRLISNPEKQRRILRPDELAAFLTAALQRVPELVAYLALGEFAGLRNREMQGLTWPMIRPVDVHIPNAITKSRAVRFIPINPTLRAWLGAIPHGKSRRMVVPADHQTRVHVLRALLANTHAEPALQWVADCLRHGYFYYCLANAGAMRRKPLISRRKATGLASSHLDIEAYWSTRPSGTAS